MGAGQPMVAEGGRPGQVDPDRAERYFAFILDDALLDSVRFPVFNLGSLAIRKRTFQDVLGRGAGA